VKCVQSLPPPRRPRYHCRCRRTPTVPSRRPLWNGMPCPLLFSFSVRRRFDKFYTFGYEYDMGVQVQEQVDLLMLGDGVR
jgi:hypothetical protein